MSQRRFPVQPVGVAYLCDECQKGLAVATGQTNAEGLHRHTCNNCNFNYFFPVKYPTVEWRFPKLEEVQETITKQENQDGQKKTATITKLVDAKGAGDELGET